MNQTRREFLVTTGMGVCAVALSGGPNPSSVRQTQEGAPLLHDGDPYTAHVHDEGLGGRCFEAMREHALRFRSSPDDRDRYVLGLEV